MKMTSPLPRVAVLFLAGILVSGCSKPKDSAARKPLLYQSPMHPWITSDKPGNCTICGMQLVPVYEGQMASDSSVLSLSPETARVIGLETATAAVEPLEKSIRFSGVLEDDDTLHRVVAAFYDGRIEQVFVQQVGEKVKAGQPLASIYSPDLLYVVREYQNAVTQGGKNDAVARNARHRLIQYGLVPAQVDALATAPRDRYAVDILAPMDGTVLVRNAYQGQYVKNGERLFEIGNLSRLWFKAEVYEKDLPFIRIGQKVEITSPAAPGRTFAGEVTFLDPNFDPSSRSTKIRIEVDNPLSDKPGSYERVLPHRAYAEAELRAPTQPVLSVPRAALIRDGKREVVYVEKRPGEFEMRTVQAGRSGDGRVEILSGLSAGEVVAARGNLMLDAEAQLRSGGQEAESPKKTLPVPLADFFGKLAAISSALASDDLAAAEKEVPWKIDGTPDAGSDAALSSVWSRLQALPPLEKAADLAEFRREFHVWSTAAAEAVLDLKKAGYIVPVHVFECPMTGDSFPGAPDTSRWVQSSGETANPYLGQEMKTCGKEVAK